MTLLWPGIISSQFMRARDLIFGNTGTLQAMQMGTDYRLGTIYTAPSTLPTAGGAQSVALNPSGNVVAWRAGGTPGQLGAHAWSNGWGAKYNDASTSYTTALLIYGQGVSWTPSGGAVAFATTTSPFIVVHPWSSGFGAKIANPATLPANTGATVAFNAAGTAVAVGGVNTPFVAAYPWSNNTFGAKYADPSPAPGATVTAIAFSPSGSDIVMSTAQISQFRAYRWSNGWSTAYTAASPGGAGTRVGAWWSQAGTTVACGNDAGVFVYPFSGSGGSGFGTVFSQPAGASTARGNAATWLPDDLAVAIGSASATASIRTFNWSGSGWGALISESTTYGASSLTYTTS